MFLTELYNQSGVLKLLHQVNDAFMSDDILRKENAARYLAFLMTYRDFDFLFKEQGIDMLPVETFLRPGIETTIAALQQFVNGVGDNKSIDKRVLKYTKRFLEGEDGQRYFRYQLTKVQDYFKRRANELNKPTSQAPKTST